MKKILSIVLLISAQNVLANPFELKLEAMCENVKKCALKSLDTQQIPEEMRPMIEAQFAKMCQPMLEQFKSVNLLPEIVKKAGACIDSKASLSCEKLMDSDYETSECKSFQDYSEKMNKE